MKTAYRQATNLTKGTLSWSNLLLVALTVGAPQIMSAQREVPFAHRAIATSAQGRMWQVPSAISQAAPSSEMAPASVTISTVDTELYTGYENAIYAADNSTVYVAYKRFLSDPRVSGLIPAELRVAKSTDAGQTWTIGVVDPDAIEEGDTLNNSVSIDGDLGSTVYVAYYTRTTLAELKVAKSTDGGATWSTQTLAGNGIGGFNSVRVLSATTAVISARGGDTGVFGVHAFITKDGGVTWSDSLVAEGPSGLYTSVGAADLHSIWVSYADGQMEAGRRVQGGSWLNFLVDDLDDGVAGLGSSITVTPGRRVFTAYEADTIHGVFVRVASTKDGTEWNVVDVQKGQVGVNTAIHEYNGNVYVSYWRVPIQGDRGCAMFARSRNNGATWSPLTIPETRSVQVYLDSTAPSDTTQFESYQTVDPVTLDEPVLQVARIDD